MTSLRSRLILTFLLGTLVPLLGAIWISQALLNHSLSYASTGQVDHLSRLLEKTGREYYSQARQALKQDALNGMIAPQRYDLSKLPESLRAFAGSGDLETFETSGERGERLRFLVLSPPQILVYERPLGAIGMRDLTEGFRDARSTVQMARTRDLRRGFFWTAVLLVTALWVASMVVLLYLVNRISHPIRQLTEGLGTLAGGDLSVRLPSSRDDEVGEAIRAFNYTAGQLAQNRERLVHLTRIESWQMLARKMAHEVKNSLTPIRLTVEEIVARAHAGEAADLPFLNQASQIVVEEINALERRVRAFSELGAEPPVHSSWIDLNAVVQERVAFLRQARPEVRYETRLADTPIQALADPDLLRGVLTNLMENAAQAAGPGGFVLLATDHLAGRACVEIHDSGPGLSESALRTLFEPTISFKRGGMGLGLSIARKGALSCGGDILHIPGSLGGAAFRVLLPLRS